MNYKHSATQLLRLINLPVFKHLDELAGLMHIDPAILKQISHHPHRYYRKYYIRKASGGRRLIRQPNKTVKAVQAWLLRYILDHLNPSQYATAYIKKRGLSANLLPHRNNRYFVCLDLEDFFTSISARRVTSLFMIMGYTKRIAILLSNLCSCSDCLPQGAVTSPALSNLIAAKLDRRIGAFASQRNITYTRFSDDITLSSNNYQGLCKSLPVIVNIIKSEHFKPHKLRVGGPRVRCMVTGLVKNSSYPQFGIGRRKKREMRSLMHKLVQGKSTDSKYNNFESIDGWLSYLRSVDTISYNQMIKYWGKIKRQYVGN